MCMCVVVSSCAPWRTVGAPLTGVRQWEGFLVFHLSVCADQSGKVRIWDTTQKEHILKYEYQPISGAIKDIAWDGESKRVAVCGEGREK